MSKHEIKYECPACSETITTAEVVDGKLTKCPECQQRLRVLLRRTPPRQGWLTSPRTVIVSGLAGTLCAAGIVLVWFFLGRMPSGPEPGGKVAQAGSESGKRDTDPKKDNTTGKDKDKDGTKTNPIGPMTTPPRSLSDEEVYQKLLKSCVWIVVPTGPGRALTGSGSVVDVERRLVLTNEHVANPGSKQVLCVFPLRNDGKLVPDNPAYLKAIKEGNAIKARVVKADRAHDLALLQLDKLPDGTIPLYLAAQSVRPGQKLHSIGGNPRGSKGQWIYSNGNVRQVSSAKWRYEDGFPRGATVIESTMPINQGDSGGPVVDSFCVLVGVNAMFDSEGRLTSAHIDRGEVHDFLKGIYREQGWGNVPDPVERPADGNSLAKLLKALESPDAAEREKAVKELGTRGTEARPAVPALLKLLQEPKEGEPVRLAAEQALAEIGPPAREQLPEVIKVLQDARSSKPARRYAASALSKQESTAKENLPVLAGALKDNDAEIRRLAVAALSKIEPVAKDLAQAELVGVLRDPDLEVRKNTLKTLLDLGPPATSPTDKMKAVLTDATASLELRAYAVKVLVDVGKETAPALAAALSASADADYAVLLTQGLGRLKVRTAEVGQALVRALDHKELLVRVAAADALMQLGLDGPTTLPGFLKALNSSDADVRATAVKGLTSNISVFIEDLPSLNMPKESLGSLQSALASEEAVARFFAAYALGSLGEAAAPAAPALRAALLGEKKKSPKLSYKIRLEILAALAEIGPAGLAALGEKADLFVKELQELVNDEQLTPFEKTAAALVLAKLVPTKKEVVGIYPVLAKALLLKDAKTPDPIEKELHGRAKKALALGGTPAADAVALALRITFLVGTEPEKVHAGVAAFNVLGKIGPPAAKSTNVNQLFTLIRNPRVRAKLIPEVLEAFDEASVAVYKKN